MNIKSSIPLSLSAIACLVLSCNRPNPSANAGPPWSGPNPQVPTWSRDDMQFFLHGSISDEMIPESVLRAFIQTYPDLFPSPDLTHLGLLPDPDFGWPVGVSRGTPVQLASLSSIGLNCAACHYGEVQSMGSQRVRVLGMTSHFDVEGFYNSIIAATLRTADAANMRKFLAAYMDQSLAKNDAATRAAHQKKFEAAWDAQQTQIAAAIAADPSGSRGAGPGGLHNLTASSLELTPATLDRGVDFPALAGNMLKLFHNIRAALHVPDQLPAALPPSSGPGRNDAFGTVSAALFSLPMDYAPVKYGLVWNLDQRHWVHWDWNTQSPIVRNMLASLGLGAPLIGNKGQVDFRLIERHTKLTEKIAAPRYPFKIDRAAAARGEPLFAEHCASCHAGDESDRRLCDLEQVGTDPLRAKLFTPAQAERFVRFAGQLEVAGYKPSAEPDIRCTGKYAAPTLTGVWARSPYLHNGSVRTMQDLLMPPASRPATFHRGSRVYDQANMGYTDSGPYLLDTKTPGNSNAGHNYATSLSDSQKHDLIEYLKTL